MTAQILVVEDEADIQELICFHLEDAGYSFHAVGDGREALRAVADQRPDLVLLDLMLPGMSGTQVCKALRKEELTATLPIIILTARGEENDIVQGLNAGADDYITKPFKPSVLLARIKAVLRRTDTVAWGVQLLAGPLHMHEERREATLNGKLLHLTFTEFQVLKALAAKPGWVFTRYQIVDASKGEDHIISERAVDVQIVGLRKKLGEYAAHIETVRGVGYRFLSMTE